MDPEPEEHIYCRLCFSLDNLSDAIFPADGPPNQSLIAMIRDCTSIRISFEPDLPCSVCETCLQMLKQFYGYRQQCLANDRQLRDQREDDDGDVDPFEDCFAMDGDQQFYGQVEQQIREFLETKIEKIERMALAKVHEMLRSRDEEDFNDSEQDTINWKSKYLILQKNNELLQKAFQVQKTKLKQTEHLLNSCQLQSTSGASQPDIGFTTHPAIPDVSLEHLQSMNIKSGACEKGDRRFISQLAVAVFGEDVLINSSVTGRPSNSHHNIPPKPQLCPLKLSAIGAKLYERVEQEVGRSNRKELLRRSSEKIVRLVVCQKSMNLRKQALKRSQGSNSLDGDSADEEEYEKPVVKRKRR